MNRQVYILVFFTLLILYFTGCQRAQESAEAGPQNFPPSTPIDFKGLPGTKLHEVCPDGVVRENSQASNSDLFVFRSPYKRPDGCALRLHNAVFHRDEDNFETAVLTDGKVSYYLSYRIDSPQAPLKECVPQNSVWKKVQEPQLQPGSETYNEVYERLDLKVGEPKEILYLSGTPKPFPGHLVGIRKAVCE